MRAWHVVVAAAALALLAACGPMVDEQAQLKIAASELQADMTAANTARPDETPRINPESQAKGDAGKLSRAFKAFIIRAFKSRKSYADAVARIEPATTPQALSKPGGFTQARSVFADASAAMDRYAEDNKQNVATLRAAMATFPPRLRDSFEAGFQRSLAEEGGVNAILSFERRNMVEQGKLLDDLERSRAHWTASGGSFVFSRDADLRAFQEHQQAVRAIVTEEQSALMALRVRQSARIQRFSETTD